jgi:hypothetical protein
MKPPLTLVEEIVLLSLDDETGAHLPLPPSALGYGIAGAILSDLIMAERISVDGSVKVLNSEKTNNPLLDPWLQRIVDETYVHSIHYWISAISDEKRDIESSVLDHLIERGILIRKDKKILWVVGLRRYPTIHNEERVEVRTRLQRLIFSDDKADHFDSTLISLLDGCYLLPSVLPESELADRSERIDEIAKSDPVGREVAIATRETLDALMRSQSATLASPEGY